MRQVLLPLWNAWYFFIALRQRRRHVEARCRTDATDVLDRYVLAKTHELVAAVTEQMDAYDLSGACAAVRAYLDALTNWYIRRSRDRFWAGDQDAFDTLYTVLARCAGSPRRSCRWSPRRSTAGLTGERSVHLADWPDRRTPSRRRRAGGGDGPRPRGLLGGAASARPTGCGSGCRCASLTVAAPDAAALAPFADLVADEVNVKEVGLDRRRRLGRRVRCCRWCRRSPARGSAPTCRR